ncbi:MAG: hypothetical protein OSA99_19840 [Acidimicrobiales bacterium]|nr:hypothetical protein [Acidimicrobiales bacterium]
MFFGADALPDDPTARLHERRGRRWLVLSYLLCPCHIPITLALIGAVLGGSALGAVLTGNAVRVAVVLTSLYGVVLWRGFRQIRIAKRLEASGRTLICTPTGCDAGSTRDETDVGVARQNWTS